MSQLTISEGRLEEIVSAHVAKMLPTEIIDALADRHIAKRIGMLTFDEAAKFLHCENHRQLADFCRGANIPIEYFGKKKRFILIAEIEAAQQRKKVQDAENKTGSEIGGAP